VSILETIKKVPVEDIKLSNYLTRQKTNISELANSMREVGQLCPIVLNGKRELISGGRRLSAVKQLGWPKIKVQYLDDDVSNLDEALINIDLNLTQLELNSFEFDICMSRKKRIYLEKYPHSAKGKSNAVDKEDDEYSFAKTEAKRLGVAPRTLDLAIARADKSSDSVLKARSLGTISPTINNEIIKLKHHDQDKILSVLQEEKPNVASVKFALAKFDTEGIEGAIEALRVQNEMSNVIKLEALIDRTISVLQDLVNTNYKLTNGLSSKIRKVSKALRSFSTKNKPILRKSVAADKQLEHFSL